MITKLRKEVVLCYATLMEFYKGHNSIKKIRGGMASNLNILLYCNIHYVWLTTSNTYCVVIPQEPKHPVEKRLSLQVPQQRFLRKFNMAAFLDSVFF